ncbi:transcriptional regulator [Pseudomonas aeruginosa]|nr:transcriptional regulator [Pseudomonas aeruginosa]
MSRVAPRDSAAQAASAVAESVRYQGRKASRQGSEQRRQAILDAAMRLIVRDGVRAVRHRAVAAEAQVPLSATTYYFKDIDDLITDTFALFVERNAEALSAFWSSVEGDLQEMAAVLADDPGARGSLVERIVELAVQYVQVQLTERREHLLAEQAFRQEALLNPRLRETGRCPPADSLPRRRAFLPGARFRAARAGRQGVDVDYSADGISGPRGRGRATGRGRNARHTQTVPESGHGPVT